jgi:hypothetical protein
MLKMLSLRLAEVIDITAYSHRFPFFNNQNREVLLSTLQEEDASDRKTSFLFTVKDVVTFECFPQTNQIYYKLLEYGTHTLLRYWFSHTLLPIYFTIKNEYYFLHACGVRVENKTVLFMADSMGGKSTLTNHFIEKNHTLVSDDKVGTYEENGTFMCVPSHPHYRPHRGFEDLGLEAPNFEQNATQLGVIYMLDVNEVHEEVSIKEIKGLEKFAKLIRGTEIGLPFFLKERFAFITKLANGTAVYRVQIPKDLNRLNEVYDAIVAHTTNKE